MSYASPSTALLPVPKQALPSFNGIRKNVVAPRGARAFRSRVGRERAKIAPGCDSEKRHFRPWSVRVWTFRLETGVAFRLFRDNRTGSAPEARAGLSACASEAAKRAAMRRADVSRLDRPRTIKHVDLQAFYPGRPSEKCMPK
jgi:hypothetical protein